MIHGAALSGRNTHHEIDRALELKQKTFVFDDKFLKSLAIALAHLTADSIPGVD